MKTREKTVSDGSPDASNTTSGNLPNVQAGPPAKPVQTPGNDGGGVDGAGEGIGAIERAQEAAADAVAEFLDSKKAGRGGQAANPAKVAGISVDSLGNGAGQASMGIDGSEDSPDGLEDDGEEVEQAFLSAGSEMAVDAANDLAETVMELYALHQLGDPEKAAIAAQKVRMNPRRYARMIKAAERLAKRYPERATKVFGFLVWWDPGVWLGDVAKQFRIVGLAGQRLRSSSSVPASAAVTSVVVTPTPAVIPKGTEPDFT